MPRPLLAILKACWAVLAWVLFLSGVIGCAGGRYTNGVLPQGNAASPELFSSPRRVSSPPAP